MAMKHVIIGAGPAGIIAAETLRKLDRDAQIQVLGDEPEPPYSRMALPYFLNGQITAAGACLRNTGGYYAACGIEVIQERVTAIDPRNHSVTTAGKIQIPFDRLLIAAGSTPVRPPIPGADLPGVQPCWTLADARNIIARTADAADVVLIGAGFIGCIILEALVGRGVRMQVIEMEDRMVARMMDEAAGGLIKRWCEDRGLKVFTSTRVTGIEQGSGGLMVSLNDGNVLHANLVITATGVLPNTGFLDDSGIETGQGILVNEYLQTSHPDIYAAGDICQGRDFSTGGYNVQAIQPTAAEHGRIAAMNMNDRRLRHQGCINMNVLDTMGLISTSYGLWSGAGGGDSVTLEDAERFRYLNLQFDDDVLVGAQTLGLTEHIGIIRGLIQARIRLGRWRDRLIKDPTRIMEAWLGCTQAIGYNAGTLR